ncbi:MAG: anthranilate phosphoribosyltransferase [Endomicrobiales bacterium]|nr:anthranilate phosphoribosyltransferase [Endomicrobiales bacterium]
MIKSALAKIVAVTNLTQDEAFAVMSQIMSGNATEAQIAAFITALRMKGETIDEITGFSKAMRQFSLKISPNINDTMLDTCGTGGDGAHTFNISTIAAITASAAGVVVAKHGNRSVSSLCGSADILQELGVKIDISADSVKKCIEKIGIGFMFAPSFHPAMRYAAAPRKQIGIRTVFNLLGPLTNPAIANTQLVGLYNEGLLEKITGVLRNLGLKRALVVCGKDGLDEITVTSKTSVCELTDGLIKKYEIEPEDFGMIKHSIKELVGGDAKVNAKIANSVLNGQKNACLDAVVINAGAGIYVAKNLSSISDGIKLAFEAIKSGAAKAKLEALVKLTNELS